jgi:hypothetical protein
VAIISAGIPDHQQDVSQRACPSFGKPLWNLVIMRERADHADVEADPINRVNDVRRRRNARYFGRSSRGFGGRGRLGGRHSRRGWISAAE